jgi:hypothetical protein
MPRKEFYPGAKTVPQFCEGRFSITTYYKMKRAGWGPQEFRVPGVRLVLITAKAEQEWEERLAGRKAQAAIEREFERNAKLASIAGKIAAKSPNFHANRKRA